MKYDYLIVGAGLFGSIFAHEATKKGYSCLVIDKRNHTGGNLYCQEIADIQVHRYGAHIFHTNNLEVWNYINQFSEFNRYTNSPLANYNGEIYNLPFNMNTFHQMWGVTTPAQAQLIIAQQKNTFTSSVPSNLEEQAISLVGTDIYQKLIKGYTEKQWGRKATELPPFIIKRLPVRFTYDNNYFNDRYQGIPCGGYNPIFNKLLNGTDVQLNTDYFDHRQKFTAIATKTLFTGMLDAFYNYQFGPLEYRSLHFQDELLDLDNYQGNAVVNYTASTPAYTRIIEHKHFEFGNQSKTVITKEFPAEWKPGIEPYYPVNDAKNSSVYQQYLQLAQSEPNVLFGGRLAEYKYYDMHIIIKNALELCKRELV